MVVTIAQRKEREILRMVSAAAEACDALAAYAAANGGRFTMFGSFARADIVPGSDFDVLVTFPAPAERAARDFAETTCRDVGLVPDVHLASEASAALMVRVERDGIALI